MTSRLRTYSALSKIPGLGYRGKILLIAFVGIHVPLIGLLAWMAWLLPSSTNEGQRILLVALAGTLVGTGLTLVALERLLRPVHMTARALRRYRLCRELPDLPTGHQDEVGTLMADTQNTINRLDANIRDIVDNDPVTGLANRTRFQRFLTERFTRRAVDAAPEALCTIEVVDIDRMIGAQGRDQIVPLLSSLSRTAEDCLGHSIPMCRTHSSALSALIPDGDYDTVLRKTNELLSRMIQTSHETIGVNLDLRAGLSFYPVDANDTSTLIDNTLVALSFARQQGVSVAVFSESKRQRLLDRYVLERDLRRALQGNELSLSYQPVFDTERREIVGAEALIRWQHPERGELPPAEFMPAAESAGLIEQIGLWTLRSVCRQISNWQQSGVAVVPVGFNLSARQFKDPRLVKSIRTNTSRYDVDPSLLEIEITESSAMVDTEHAAAVLGDIRDLGVAVSLDDVGTGFSSLGSLCTLPLSKLKIDRGFVHRVDVDSDRLAINRALIALARELNLEVVAKGVESGRELKTLHDLGCRLFQGHYFSAAVRAANFGEMLHLELDDVRMSNS